MEFPEQDPTSNETLEMIRIICKWEPSGVQRFISVIVAALIGPNASEEERERMLQGLNSHVRLTLGVEPTSYEQ